MNGDLVKFIFLSLFRRGLRSVLTVLGISIGIAAVVALIALSSGMQEGIKGEFESLGSDKLIIRATGSAFGPPGTAVVVPLTTSNKESIDDLIGVKLSLGRLIRTVNIEDDESLETAFVVTMPDTTDEFELVKEAMQIEIGTGRWANKGSHEVVFGSGSAEDMFENEVFVGDTVFINKEEFEVSGIIESTGNPEKDDSLMMSEKSMRDLFDLDDELDIIIAQSVSEDDLPAVEARIEEVLRDDRGVKEGQEDFSVESPQALLETLSSILLVVQGVLVGIASIALVVGSVGIMNTMFTSVVERRREIGILRSFGVRRHTVRLLFLIESGVLGLAGGLVGLIIGMSAAKLLEIVLAPIVGSALLQVHFSYTLLIVLLILSTVVGAVSGYFPAREASNITPLEALRS
ncbi:ABC transporter permease [archaeon]|jgi:putative ABC transport system permease protein|nr:ABC transporter permease [archaeon]